MRRLAWMTDLFLNFLPSAGRLRFLETTRDQADGFVISGDIAESRDVVDTLLEMQRVWDKPALAEALHRLGDEAAWYDGRHSDDNYLPHFACQAVGQVMRRVMQSHPQRVLEIT